MYTITAMNTQKRNKNRVNVFLDGRFAFGLSIGQTRDLSVGQTITKPEVSLLRSVDEVENARDKALRFLAHRPRSESEVRTRMARHGLGREVVQGVIESLGKDNVIDDEAFAAFWVENRSAFRPRGRRALRVELRQKGVGDEVIETVLGSVDELGDARKAAVHEMSRLQGLAVLEWRQKMREFLSRRGFDYEIISEVIEEMMQANNDHKD